jgi:hypothetical protein
MFHVGSRWDLTTSDGGSAFVLMETAAEMAAVVW